MCNGSVCGVKQLDCDSEFNKNILFRNQVASGKPIKCLNELKTVILTITA